MSACTRESKPAPAAAEAGTSEAHWVIAASVPSLDPAQASDTYTAGQVGYAYEGLLQYHYLKRPYVLTPLLAVEMPRWAPDKKTLTLKLKRGVKFHDDPVFVATRGMGREVVADDFVYSILRVADPRGPSSAWPALAGRIVGLDEWRADMERRPATDFGRVVEGLRALDQYVVQIRLTRPDPGFFYLLAMPMAFVVAREAVGAYGGDFRKNPVGTGPFALDRKNSDLEKKLIWVRNPTYREELYPADGEPGDREAGNLDDKGRKLPLLDRVVVSVAPESDVAWSQFTGGKVDVLGVQGERFKLAVSPAKELNRELAAKGIRLEKMSDLDVTHVTFNLRDPVLGPNRALRQALSLAYDGERAIQLFYEGRAVPAQGPIPPGLEGYDPKYVNPYRRHDLDAASAKLKEAGYPGGKGLAPLTYASPSNTASRRMAEYFAEQMARIGVRVNIVAKDWPEFQGMVRERKAQVFGYAWVADYPEAENFMRLFYSRNTSPFQNDSGYSNPEFDGLFEKSLALPPGQDRVAVYRRMTALLAEDCPWIFGVHRVAYVLVQPWLKNYKIHAFDLGRAKYLRVKKPEAKPDSAHGTHP